MVERSVISKAVTKILKSLTGKDTINETDHLKNRLLLSASMVSALGSVWSRISKDFGGRRITMAEASELKTVAAVVTLIWKRANQG